MWPVAWEFQSGNMSWIQIDGNIILLLQGGKWCYIFIGTSSSKLYCLYLESSNDRSKTIYWMAYFLLSLDPFIFPIISKKQLPHVKYGSVFFGFWLSNSRQTSAMALAKNRQFSACGTADDDGRPLAMTVCCQNSSTFDRGLLHHFEHAVL
jgi:hypothetical protein